MDVSEPSAWETKTNPDNITKEITANEIRARSILLVLFFIRLPPFQLAKRFFQGMLLNVPGPI